MPFQDRREAGRRLARLLERFAPEQPVVLGLPRGGVPVAFEVARALQAPLDVIVVRKLGLPSQPELAMGAIGEGGVRVLNDEVIALAGVRESQLNEVERRERAELERRASRFRGARPPTPLTGRTVIVVDDGLATGSTALAALRVARAHGARRVVLAVPVAPAETLREMLNDADEVVCVDSPANMYAIGTQYTDFAQISDDEVVHLLEATGSSGPAPPVDDRRSATAGAPALAPGGTADRRRRDEELELHVDSTVLEAHLCVPAGAGGMVVFAHGSGSSRHSPRNRFVAGVLQDAGLATLLFDLLTGMEEVDRANVFDVELLGSRLSKVIEAVGRDPALAALPIGVFGASTGAAAALWSAAEPSSHIEAVVSRGGRPDLAGQRLGAVRAPTLLIVGGADDVVLAMNREAAARMRCECRIEVVNGASHLFEEPGTLADAAALARDWFVEHLLRDVSSRHGS